MSETLSQHLLIDLYACYDTAVQSPAILQDSLTEAMEAANQSIDEISCQVFDDEIILIALSARCHVAMHAYPSLGYVAADIYTFDNPFQTTLIMRELKKSLGAERVKATSVNRGDFGSIQDMKPRRQSSFTALGRVTRTRTRLKKTGTKLKSTGVKVIEVLKGKNSGINHHDDEI